MSDLTSLSSYEDALDAYLDAASWEEDQDVDKAKAFITACRFLRVFLMKRSETQSGGGGNVQEFDPHVLAQEMAEARAWVATQRTEDVGERYLHFDSSNYMG